MPAAPRRSTVLAAAGSILLALMYWWPLPAHMATATIAQPFGDPLLNAWTLAWDADRWRHGFDDYWAGLFFYPYRDTVAYSEHLLGIAVFTAPLQWLTGNPILVLNAATVAATALAAFGMFLLARQLTGRTDAALLAGVAFACSPYRLAHAYHLQVLVSGWMPIAFYGLHRYLASASRTALGLFVVAFVLQGLSNGYFLFFTAIPAAVIAADGLWRARGDLTRRVAGLGVAALVVLLAIAPVALAYMRVKREQGFTRTLADIVTYSATPEAYVHVSPRSWLWSGVLPAGREELQLFPGMLVALLTGAAVVAAWRLRGRPEDTRASLTAAHRHDVWLYVGIVALMLLFSLGPQPSILGARLPFSGPYAWLRAVVPGLDGLRVPARMATVVSLGLSVLAAFGFAALCRRADRASTRGVLATAMLIALVEGHGGLQPIAAFPTRDMAREAAAYTWLASQPPGPMIELPVGDAALATRHLYRTLHHGNRIVNGYSGYGSILQDFIGGPPFTEVARIDDALAMARTIGIRWVLIHPSLYDHPSAGGALAEAVATSRQHVARAERFEGVVAVELREPLPPPDTARDPRARELRPPAFTVHTSHNEPDVGKAVDGDASTRWASGAPQGSGEAITLVFADPADVAHLRLELGARSLGDYPRGLVVETSADGEAWQTVWSEDVLTRLGVSLVREPRTPGIDIRLPTTRAGRLRLRTMGTTRAWFWSIHELRVWVR